MRRDSGSLIFAGIFFLISGAAVLYFFFRKDKVKSKNDIEFISGPFEGYDWIDKGGGKGSSLTFHLLNDSSTFKIKADFFPVLRKDNFKKIPHGATLKIGIPNKKTGNLNLNRKTIFVYSITSDDFTYLDLEDTIKKHNSNLFLFAAGFFGISGALLIYFGRKAKVRTRIF